MSPLVEEAVVLAVGAHRRTVEQLCAGTLALLRERGWRVAVASMTLDGADPGEFRSVRRAAAGGPAAHSAAALLETHYHCLGAARFAITYGDRLCRRMTGVLRAVRPAIVLTHGPDDAVPDHEETRRIVCQACLAAPAKSYRTRGVPGRGDPTGRIPHLYYVDPPELSDALGRPVPASLIVDISATIEAKTSLLAQQADQPVWGYSLSAADQNVEAVRTWAQKRGEQAGCRFGEGFRQHVGPAYPRDNLLRDVLGPLGHEVG